ncbi:MAG TPA: nuclear transport factor 2 family protein [Gemmatimonadaceae bacterium]|nr:nuclear transport factor 2 family protein [Gemmatimonadaceae bacterium]
MIRFERAVLVVLLVTAACRSHVQAMRDPATVEAEIRARSHAIVAAEQQQDLEAIMQFYAEDAVVHVEGAAAARGHAAIRRLYGEYFQMPIVAFDATITHVAVGESGDLGYETGVNNFTLEQGGQQVPLLGKYLAVWRRGPDGRFRIVALAVTNDRAP